MTKEQEIESELVDVEEALHNVRSVLSRRASDTIPALPPNTYQTNVIDTAARFLGTKEVSGGANNAQIVAMLELDASWAHKDEIPWCSAFVNYVAFLLGLERTKSLRARSWLFRGEAIPIAEAQRGDVVIFSRGTYRPGPEVLKAPGHVAFFSGNVGSNVLVLGGNQGDTVSHKEYPAEDILGVRRLSLF